MTHSDPSKSAVHLRLAPSGGTYSHSSLRRFAQCPRSYQLAYREARPPEPSPESGLGAVLHETVARLVLDHWSDGSTGPIDRNRVAARFRFEWACSGLSDPAMFRDGLALVKRWVAREGAVDYRAVLSVNAEFTIDVEGVRLVGTIERADRIGEDAVRVRAYTSSRIPPTRQEVEENLQLAIYDLAAAQLWPWAKRVEVGLDLLRHDRVIVVERTGEHREATRHFVRAMAERIESASSFPARLSTQCTRCEQRNHCEEYTHAVATSPRKVQVDEHDLRAVVREREDLAARIKILGVHKDALDAILTEQLASQDELILEGRRYRLVTAARKEYPLAKTLDVLEGAGVDPVRAFEHIAAVDGAALKRVLDELAKRLDAVALRAVKAELDEAAKWSLSTRLTSREVQS